jgi:predicted AlkP superfamily pyrophosphatase or phosphodiesterase
MWLDGFKTDYLSEEKTPFMYKFSQEALVGEYQPLLAFTGIGVSIFTGVTPQEHGVWVEFCHDPEGSPFKWVEKLSVLSAATDAIVNNSGRVGTIFHGGSAYLTFRVSNKLSGNSLRPLALKVPIYILPQLATSMSHDISERRMLPVPTLFDILSELQVPFRFLSQSLMKDHQILKRALQMNPSSEFVCLQLGELDKVGHSYGPESEQVFKSLRKMDSLVWRIIRTYKKRSDLNVFIFADHGMKQVEGTVNIQKILRKTGLKEGTDYLAFLNSTIVQLWFFKESAERRIMDLLDDLCCGRFLTEQDLRHYQIPFDRKYGDALWLVNPGRIILPNYYQGSTFVRGMHGYTPEVKDLHSPFIISGDGVAPGKVEHISNPMEIFSTILDLLGITIPSYVQGRSLMDMG